METLVFMIIIGILSTIFGKAKKSNTQSKNKPTFPNKLEEIRTIFNKQFENQTHRRTNSIPETQPAILESMEEKYLQVKNDSEVTPSGMSNQPSTGLQRSKKGNEPINDKLEGSDPIFSESLDAKTLINGIIWAEVLGEPRSKKSYFARKG